MTKQAAEKHLDLIKLTRNIPQWLKPRGFCCTYGTTKVVP